MLRFLLKAMTVLVAAGYLTAPVLAQEDRDAGDKKDATPKVEPKAIPLAPFDFPNFDELFKGVPLDPEQAKQLKMQLERAREQFRQAMEEMKKKGGVPGFPGAIPPGLVPPGGIPGIPPMLPGFPPMPPGFPGGGPGFPPGFPGMPGMPGEGRFGIQVESPSNILREQLELKEEQGLVVVNVRPGSAAEKAGLKMNDIILEWGGKSVSSDPADLKAMVDVTREAVEVKVLRKGKAETLKGVTVPERKADPSRPRPRIDVRAPRLESTPTLVRMQNTRMNCGS